MNRPTAPFNGGTGDSQNPKQTFNGIFSQICNGLMQRDRQLNRQVGIISLDSRHTVRQVYRYRPVVERKGGE